MPDLCDLTLPHSELPEYDYDKFIAMSDPNYVKRGEVAYFEYKAFERSPGEINTGGKTVAELLRM